MRMNRKQGSRAAAGLVVGIAVVAAAAGVTGAGNPHGSRIAFEGDRYGGWGIGAMRSDGSAAAAIGPQTGPADASWSPNGQSIAFEADADGDGNLEIFVMDADGGNVRRLTDSPGRDFWPDWFPDGRQIAFTSDRTGVPNIYVVDVETGEARALTTDTEFGNLEPDVSPNGQQIVFMRAAQFEPPAIWTINTDGSGLAPLTAPGPHDDLDPQWSPNGQRVVFSSNRSGTYEIWVMDADGAFPVKLTASPGADFNPTFSPDGRQIAWWKLRFGQGDVWTMSVDGSDQVNLTNSPAFEGFPDWHQGHLGQ